MEIFSAKQLLYLLPPKCYHAQGGRVDVFSEKNLSFGCGCGVEHNVNNSLAIIDTGLTNKAIYVCPSDEKIFNLVGVKGVFTIKGLKNLGCFKALSTEEAESFLAELESRKRRD